MSVRTGVLGGTFDPPHIGHLVLGAAAHRALGLDRVLFVPAGQPWRKAGRPVSAPEPRLAMVQAAVAGLEWAEVSDLEVRRPGETYAVDTLSELTRDGGEWWFIVGRDALEDMPHWRDPERLLELARLGVAVRPPADDPVPAEARARFPGIEQRADVVAMPPLYASSSDLRQRFREGRPTTYLVPEAVRRIADEHGLYRGPDARED